MSRTKLDLPQEPRPMTDQEWNNYLTELVMAQMVEEFGPDWKEADGE